MATEDNVMAAFAGESQANRKYLLFSEKAAAEGFPNVAKLFRAASDAEAVHAKRLFITHGLDKTVENLKAAIAGETEEFTDMYPEFIKTSEAEGKDDATKIFNLAMKAEKVHAGLYKAALEAVSTGKDFEITAVYLCPVCGNIQLNKAPGTCPICGVPAKTFKEITL